MKNIIIILLLFPYVTIAQQNPTGAGVNGSGANAATYWARGGNLQQGPGNNLFGTLWNSPIYTRTNNITFMKLNGQFGAGGAAQYNVNGYGAANINTTGYFLLGESRFTVDNNNLFVQLGAYSLLHLNGRQGLQIQQGGFKPWMKTGITFTDNQDMSYFGLRQVGTGNDVTETVISCLDQKLFNLNHQKNPSS